MKRIKTTCNTEFIVDDNIYNEIKDLSFSIHKIEYKGKVAARYVRIYINKSHVYLHRYIIGAKKNQMVDHVNGNGLDNRIENLRICTRSQNGANSKSTNRSSKFKGVSIDKSVRGKKFWKAQITKNGKTFTIGRFYNEIDAARAYDKKAIEFHGNFAKTNKDLGFINE